MNHEVKVHSVTELLEAFRAILEELRPHDPEKVDLFWQGIYHVFYSWNRYHESDTKKLQFMRSKAYSTYPDVALFALLCNKVGVPISLLHTDPHLKLASLKQPIFEFRVVITDQSSLSRYDQRLRRAIKRKTTGSPSQK